MTHKNILDATLDVGFARVQARIKDAASRCQCGMHHNGLAWPCHVHDRFVQPLQPYQGMWMATRAQLAFFMAHSYWVKEEALNATLAIDMIMGYPERSTVMNLLINVREGFASNCMVPFVISGQRRKRAQANIKTLNHSKI